MDLWRTPTEEEANYLVAMQKKDVLPNRILYSFTAILLLFLLVGMLSIFIEAGFDFAKNPFLYFIVASLFVLIPASYISVKALIETEQAVRKYRAREITIAYGTVKKKWTGHSYKSPIYYIGVKLDDGTKIDQRVSIFTYFKVTVRSKMIVVQTEPASARGKVGYRFFLVPEPEMPES